MSIIRLYELPLKKRKTETYMVKLPLYMSEDVGEYVSGAGIVF